MNFKKYLPVSLVINLLLLSGNASAENIIGVNPQDLAWCKAKADRIAEQSSSSRSSGSFSSDSNVGIGFNPETYSIGVSGSGADSINWDKSQSSSSYNRSITEKDCHDILIQAGETTRAKIFADLQRDLQFSRERINDRNAQSAERINDRNAIAQENISKTVANSNIITTGITAGANVLGTMISPPSRGQEAEAQAKVEIAKIQAEVEKERIALERLKSDPQSNSTHIRTLGDSTKDLRIEGSGLGNNTDMRVALIQQWGFTLSRCSSTTARISIDGQKALCVIPAKGLKPGARYSYNSATGQFKRITPSNQNYSAPAPRYTPTSPSSPNSGGKF